MSTRRKTPYVAIPLVFPLIILGSGPIEAACGPPTILTTLSMDGSSYVYTEGWPRGGDICGDFGCYTPPVGPDVDGTFWALGAGDPVVGLGDDSGSVTVDQWLDRNSWMGSYFYYPGAFVNGDWSTPGVDGCLLHAGSTPALDGDECTSLLLSDQHEGVGYFAVATALPNETGDAFLDQPGGAPIVLRPLPPVEFLSFIAIPGGSMILLELRAGPVPDEALYLEPGCDDGVVKGYRVYRQVVDYFAPEPADRRRDGNWALVSGLEDPIPIGQAVAIEQHTPCESAIYFAVSLVFDSGFETAHVSSSPRLVCADLCPDLDGDGWPGFCPVPEMVLDCHDQDPDTYPWAPEINDGKDNQCPGNPGAHLIDEISGTTRFVRPDELSWPRQDGATRYEVARSTQPDFPDPCFLEQTLGASWIDIEDPPDGHVFYYLVRALAPLTGSWGADSAGDERVWICDP